MSPIQKSFVTHDGQIGNYWVVDGVYMSSDMSSARAFVRLYPTEEAFLSGGNAIYQGEVILSQNENPVSMNALVNLVEQKLVTIPGNFLSGTII